MISTITVAKERGAASGVEEPELLSLENDAAEEERQDQRGGQEPPGQQSAGRRARKQAVDPARGARAMMPVASRRKQTAVLSAVDTNCPRPKRPSDP